MGGLFVTQPLHVAQHHRQALLSREVAESLLNVMRCFSAEDPLLRASLRVDQPRRGGGAIGGVELSRNAIEAVYRATFAPSQLVVAGVDRDAQQPAVKAVSRSAKRAQTPKCAEKRILGSIGGILGIAEGAVADVVHLALVEPNQDIEAGHVPVARGTQRRLNIRLHTSIVTGLRWLPAIVLLVPWLVQPSVWSSELRVRDASGPETFQLLGWETQHLAERAGRLWNGLLGISGSELPDAEVQTLHAYFANGADRAGMRASAEAALEHAVAQAYREDGISRAPDPLFPPVLVALTPPPNVLVVAPRTQLRVMQSVLLTAMDTPAQEQLEAAVDSVNVSSLVAPIGGLATYPSMVLEEDAPERVVASVAHEWLHQYLFFYPLGAGYWNSQETREINETTAEMVGQEIGQQVSSELGLAQQSAAAGQATGLASRFDFRGFMRETRLHTEQLLATGQVEPAEAYMRARRDELHKRGYAIRKLNQAYFALYGSYGDGFAASPANPIPDLLHRLRQRSSSLGDFVVRVRAVTTIQELRSRV